MRTRARSDAERRGAKQSMVNWSCFFEQFFRRARFCFARWFELLQACASDFARWADLRSARFFEDICDPVRTYNCTDEVEQSVTKQNIVISEKFLFKQLFRTRFLKAL